jgi:hypothetical protein
MERGTEEQLKETLAEFVKEALSEGKVREADVTDGKTAFGSEKHVKDLERRISELTPWRDRQKKGSDARANYSRIINRLKGELASARRQAAKVAVKSIGGK